MSKTRTITPNPPADFMPEHNNVRPFRAWCQKVLPLVYDDSLSYYELLCKVLDALNKTVIEVNNLGDAYDKLEDYVNHYFDNLDVQEEINKKLDELVKDGTLESLMLNLNGFIGEVLSVIDGKLMNTSLEPNKKYILMDDCTLDHTIILNGDNIKIDFNYHTITSDLDIPFFYSRLNARNEYGEFKNGTFQKKGGNAFIFDLPNVYKYEFYDCKFIVTGHVLNSTLNGAIHMWKDGTIGETGYVNKIENCHFTNAFIYIEKDSDGYVINNIIWNYDLLYAININGSQTVFTGNQIVGIVYAKDVLLLRITNNYFDGNVGNTIKVNYGLLLESVTDSLITSNTFTYCENSIKLIECDGCVISSNNFWDNNKLKTGVAEIIIESETQYKTNLICNNIFNYYAKRQQTNKFIPIKETTNFCFTVMDNNIITNNNAYDESELSDRSTNKLMLHAVDKNFNYPMIGSVELELSSATVASVDVTLPFHFNFASLSLKYPEALYNKGVTCSYTKKSDYVFTIFIHTINPETGSCTVNYMAY